MPSRSFQKMFTSASKPQSLDGMHEVTMKSLDALRCRRKVRDSFSFNFSWHHAAAYSSSLSAACACYLSAQCRTRS